MVRPRAGAAGPLRRRAHVPAGRTSRRARGHAVGPGRPGRRPRRHRGRRGPRGRGLHRHGAGRRRRRHDGGICARRAGGGRGRRNGALGPRKRPVRPDRPRAGREEPDPHPRPSAPFGDHRGRGALCRARPGGAAPVARRAVRSRAGPPAARALGAGPALLGLELRGLSGLAAWSAPTVAMRWPGSSGAWPPRPR